MKKIRIGVIGVGRGKTMIDFCRHARDVELTAICDKWEEGLALEKEKNKGLPITYYTDYDEFLTHDMDAVVLANYAHQHAPFAIKAMRAGKHVFSEVLPCQTMKEAVELVEAVEETGRIYAYGENYCFMPAPHEMRRLYREGAVGEIEYAEGEYIHNCEDCWHEIAYGDKHHWRNNIYSTFYCTHSLGPILHITGLRPVSVTGFESTKNERNLRVGAHQGQLGIEMVTLENGALVKSIHGGLYVNSIWYTLYGSQGRLEAPRELAEQGLCENIYTEIDEADGAYRIKKDHYAPVIEKSADGVADTHGGSDYLAMLNFVRKLQGDPDAEIIDVYEALDMFLPGLFAYRSILSGGLPMQIPDLRNKEERGLWRNDTACTDREAAGDSLLPPCSAGFIEIDDDVYEKQYKLWREAVEKKKTPPADKEDPV